MSAKLPLTKEQEQWISQYAEKHRLTAAFDIRTTDKAINPCIAVFGPGPEGALCRKCSHLYHNGRFLKCDLRAHTNGAATDHKARWPACAKFQLDSD
jgi:hypothetical protein